MYFCHPLAILEISIKFFSKYKYCFKFIIFISFISLTNFFIISVFTLNVCSREHFLFWEEMVVSIDIS